MGTISVETKITAIEILSYVDIVTYSGLLCFGVRNAYQYLVKQGKWRILYLTMFYFFTVEIAISRIVYFASADIAWMVHTTGTAYVLNGASGETAFFGMIALAVF